MLCLRKYRKNPFLILDHRALVEVLHVCLLPPQRVFFAFLFRKGIKGKSNFLEVFFFFLKFVTMSSLLLKVRLR